MAQSVQVTGISSDWHPTKSERIYLLHVTYLREGREYPDTIMIDEDVYDHFKHLLQDDHAQT